MIACVFPGQGSQKKEMIELLKGKYKEELEIANNILGESIQEICHNENKLNDTRYAQPILFTIHALMYKEYCAFHEAPQYLAGHSLGEYNALCAAKVFEFQEGIKLTKARGELMASIKNGGMLAIINQKYDKIQMIIQEYEGIYIANYNSFSQIVVGGLEEEIQRLQNYLNSHNIINIKLNVSCAFHTPYMKQVEPLFRKYLENMELCEPEKIVISNISGVPYNKNNIIDNLCKHLFLPVQWIDVNLYMIRHGINRVIQIGGGKTLDSFFRNVKRNYDKE